MDDLKQIADSKEIMKKVGLKRLKEKMLEGGGNADAVKTMLGLEEAGSDPQTSFAQVTMVLCLLYLVFTLWHNY